MANKWHFFNLSFKDISDNSYIISVTMCAGKITYKLGRISFNLPSEIKIEHSRF